MASYLRPYLLWLLVSIALSFLVALFETMSLWFSAPLLRTLFLPGPQLPTRPALTFSNAYNVLQYYTYRLVGSGDTIDSLKIVCLLMAVSFLLKNVLQYIRQLIVVRTNLSIVRDLRNRSYDHILRLPVSYYDRNRSGRLLSLILNEIAVINSSMTVSFDRLLVEPVRVVLFIGMMFSISGKLSLVVLLVFPLLGYLMNVIGKTVKRRSSRMFDNLSGMMAILHETIAGIRTVKMFNMAAAEGRKFAAENGRYVRNAFRSARVGDINAPMTEMMGVAVTVLLLWYGGRTVLSGGGLDPEGFLLFLVYLFSTFKPLKSLTTVSPVLQNGVAAAERVFAVLDTAVENIAAGTVAQPVQLREVIRFDHVGFSYPGTDEAVLRDIDFTVKRGQVVAFVGASGSGKSTILDLLPRFYDATSGVITIDGTDIRQCDLGALRGVFGIVAQETVLFNDTVAANISYGGGDNEQAVVEAARAANALEFIERLPRGFGTVIGERGEMLSGGQRQRLAIARALFRNPPVLILDEATSALDTESERLVQTAINNLMANRTVFMVAHRLSTITHADTIMVIEDGVITEQGTHRQLLERGGRYHHFYTMQFECSAG